MSTIRVHYEVQVRIMGMPEREEGAKCLKE